MAKGKTLPIGKGSRRSIAVPTVPGRVPVPCRKGTQNLSPRQGRPLEGALRRVEHLSRGLKASGNLLVKADNLTALKLLSHDLEGQVRCVYIDPPYNNHEEYAHYKDSLDHEAWLQGLLARLDLLVKTLRKDGSVWISIDDAELHYLKVAADMIFGRENFICTVVWEQRTTRENRKVFSHNHEYLLVYAKDSRAFSSNRHLLPMPPAMQGRYHNPDDDPRGPWQSISVNVQAGHATPGQFYTIVAPNGTRHVPPKGRCWVYGQRKMLAEIANRNIWFGRDGCGVPRRKRFLSEARDGLTPSTLWTAAEVGTNMDAKKHLLRLFPDHAVFDTPKPESLIARILSIATDPKDLVLDCYLGSGTTTAVAHKMGRRYVGIESGEHAVTHCAFRMEQVVEGESGGISEAVSWSGGGGFDFYEIA